MPTVNLQKEETLLVEGPASLSLQNGDVSILGAPVSQELVVVRDGRQLPVEASSKSMLEIRLGLGSKYRIVHGSTIPTGWREASQVAAQCRGTTAIIGDVDSGKSTLCTLIANYVQSQGLSVSVIDGDIGQADIGPPTTISLSRVQKPIYSLQDLQAELSLFIGDTSPASTEEKLSRSMLKLRELSERQSDVTLVNTDGWVQGEDAVGYKLRLLTTLQPDLVLGLAVDGELDQLLEMKESTSLKLSRSSHAKSRSRDERKRARELGYRRFLQNARRVELKIGHVRIRRFNSNQRQLRLDANDLRGVIAGLLNEEEWLMSIGRIEAVENGRLVIRSKVESTPITVELGAVVLSDQYEEVGFDA